MVFHWALLLYYGADSPWLKLYCTSKHTYYIGHPVFKKSLSFHTQKKSRLVYFWLLYLKQCHIVSQIDISNLEIISGIWILVQISISTFNKKSKFLLPLLSDLWHKSNPSNKNLKIHFGIACYVWVSFFCKSIPSGAM